MHLVLKNGSLVHASLPGADRTLCGHGILNASPLAARSARLTLTLTVARAPVTCASCLAQARVNREAIEEILSGFESQDGATP